MKYFRRLLFGKKSQYFRRFYVMTKYFRCLFRQQHMFYVYFDDNVTHRDAEKGEGRRKQGVRIEELNAGVCPSVPVRCKVKFCC